MYIVYDKNVGIDFEVEFKFMNNSAYIVIVKCCEFRSFVDIFVFIEGFDGVGGVCMENKMG